MDTLAEPDTSVIQTKNLKKSYGKHTALRGIDLNVKKGEVHGFIGPNGAGKTTTIRIILGLLRPDSGEATLLGGDPWRDALMLHRRLAYVPGDISLWSDLTGGEVIDLLGRLRGGMDAARRQELLQRFELDPTKKCGAYSKGNRQKVVLVAALAFNAELLILDEPTSGLDPLMTSVFHEYITQAKNEGKTVFLSSHVLAEVEAICDHVSIIRQGQIVESGALVEMRHLSRTSVTVETVEPVTDLENMSGVHNMSCEGTRWRFTVDPEAMDSVMQVLAQLGIETLTVKPATLEELFMRHYGHDLQQKEVQKDEKA